MIYQISLTSFVGAHIHSLRFHQHQYMEIVLYSPTMTFPGPWISHPAGSQFSADRQACFGCFQCNASHPDICCMSSLLQSMFSSLCILYMTSVTSVTINICSSAHHISRLRITFAMQHALPYAASLASMCLKVGYYIAAIICQLIFASYYQLLFASYYLPAF